MPEGKDPDDLIKKEGNYEFNDILKQKQIIQDFIWNYQMTKVDYTATASTDQDATHYGVSVAINEELSISAGRQEIDFDGAAAEEVNSGIGASYTMGSISMYGGFNKLENASGSNSALDTEATIFNISFAF